jgi:hypothetical protein
LKECNMKSFTYKCVSIQDVCKHNCLDLGSVMDAISNSDISFGSNYDTLISTGQLENILDDAEMNIDRLDYDNHDDEDIVLISIGS